MAPGPPPPFNRSPTIETPALLIGPIMPSIPSLLILCRSGLGIAYGPFRLVYPSRSNVTLRLDAKDVSNTGSLSLLLIPLHVPTTEGDEISETLGTYLYRVSINIY
jgi:hypothetical protein